MLKKSVSFIVCIIVMLAVFTGCDKKETGDSTETTAPATTEAKVTDGSTESAPEEPVQEIVDLIWLMSMNYSGFPDTEKVAEYIAEQCGSRIVPSYADSAAGGMVQKFNLMVASGEDVDVVPMTLVPFTMALQNGVIQSLQAPWDEIGVNLQKYLDPALMDWLKSKETEEIYGIPCEATKSPSAVTIRTDWLEDLNLDMPTSLEELENVMIAMRDAYDVNPLAMSIAISWPRSFDEAFGGMFLPMGYSWFESEDGTYLPPEMHPDYKAFISKLHDWYVNGIINPETFSDAYKPLIKANKIGVTAGSYSDGVQADLLNIEPDAWYEAVNGIGIGYLAQLVPSSAIQAVNINSSAEKAAAMIRLLEWIASSNEATAVSRGGIPGEHWRMLDDEKYIIENLQGTEQTFKRGSFEFLDLMERQEKRDTTNDRRLAMYYRYWEIDASGELMSYMNLDQQYRLNEALLDSADKLNDIKTAALEAKIAFITGAREMSEWETFLEEWKDVGMADLIVEKTEYFNEAIK